jgi:hypothetical protein
MNEIIFGIFTITGGIFWILAFAWFVGWAAEKMGVKKY